MLITDEAANEPNRADPDVAHVRVAAVDEAFVVEGGKALWGNVEPTIDGVGDAGRILIAQSLLADIVSADAAVVGTVTGVSELLQDASGAPLPFRTVTFAVEHSLRGAVGDELELRMFDEGHPIHDVPAIPSVGAARLLLLAQGDDGWELATAWASVRPIEEGYVGNIGPVRMRLDDLVAAVEIAGGGAG